MGTFSPQSNFQRHKFAMEHRTWRSGESRCIGNKNVCRYGYSMAALRAWEKERTINAFARSMWCPYRAREFFWNDYPGLRAPPRAIKLRAFSPEKIRGNSFGLFHIAGVFTPSPPGWKPRLYGRQGCPPLQLLRLLRFFAAILSGPEFLRLSFGRGRNFRGRRC